jgi:hypothetical protein
MKVQLLTLFLALVAIISGCNKESSSKTNTAPAGQNSPSAKVEPVAAKDTAKDDVKAAPKSVSDNWYTYAAKDGTYSAKFPGKPQEEKQTSKTAVGTINPIFVTYGDKAKNQFFLTASAKYPVNPSNYDVKKGLEGVRNGIAGKSTVLSEKEISQKDKGFPGRELILRHQNGTNIRARFYIDPSGQTLYQAMVGSESENLNSPEAIAFLDSLTIK